MPSEVLRDAFVELNGVDLSDHVRQVTLDYTAELQDATAMGHAGRARKAGLKDWSLSIEFFADWAASEIDATLFALVGTQFAVKVRKSKTDAISATNPEYQGNGTLETYTPISGAVGEMAMAPVRIVGSDGAALIRDTTP